MIFGVKTSSRGTVVSRLASSVTRAPITLLYIDLEG